MCMSVSMSLSSFCSSHKCSEGVSVHPGLFGKVSSASATKCCLFVVVCFLFFFFGGGDVAPFNF